MNPSVDLQKLPYHARNVKTGKDFDGPNGLLDALNSANDGDVIEANPGNEYIFLTTLKKTVTLRSTVPGTDKWNGPKVRISGGGQEARIFELSFGVGITLEDVELYNNKTEYGNQAGIWPTGGAYSVVLRRCVLHDLSNGILTGDHPEGTVLFEDSLVYDCGSWTEGKYHNLYIGRNKSFVMRRSRSESRHFRGQANVPAWMISWGHLVKSRAISTLIEQCHLIMGVGSENNRCVDLSNGGTAVIRKTTMLYRTTQNKGEGQALAMAPEGYYADLPHSLVVEDNLVINLGSPTAHWLWIQDDASRPARMLVLVKRNILAGWLAPSVKGDRRWNDEILANNQFVPLTAIADIKREDFRLRPKPWAAPAVLNGRAIGFAGLTGGWTYDTRDRGESIRVQCYVDGPAAIGKPLSPQIANIDRPDVTTREKAPGKHGYAITVPNEFRDDQPHELYMYGVDTGGALRQLNLSPVAFAMSFIKETPWVMQRGADGKVSNYGDAPNRTWSELPGTRHEDTIKPILDAGGYTLYKYGSGGLSSVMAAFSGMAWNFSNGKAEGFTYGGGHNDGSHNGSEKFDVLTASWSICSYPTHPTKDLTPQQLRFYSQGATNTSYVFPLADSSTGFAVHLGTFSQCGWIPVVGPERTITPGEVAFPNGDKWAAASNGKHAAEYPLKSAFAMFDGRLVPLHTYYGLKYSTSFGGPVNTSRVYWGIKATGTGMLRIPAKGSSIPPKHVSAESLWTHTDEKTGRIIWGGCGSNCWGDNYYFYNNAIELDPATWTDREFIGLILDRSAAPALPENIRTQINAGDQMLVAFKAGRWIGGLCYNNWGWTHNLDTHEKRIFQSVGEPYSGGRKEGRSYGYLPRLGKLMIFDTGSPLKPAWEFDIDDMKPGTIAGTYTVATRKVPIMKNSDDLPDTPNGLVYSRMEFWPDQQMFVFVPGTQSNVWICPVRR